MMHYSVILVVLCFICPLPSGLKASNLADENTNFAFTLYDELTKHTDGNLFLSPLSISMAMAMVSEGAAGNTKVQIDDVFGFSNLNDETKTHVQTILNEFNDDTNNYTLSLANRLFGKTGYSFEQDFLDTTSEYYQASLEELDFVGDAEGSRIHINEWVSAQTNSKIQNLLKKGTITKATVMALVNAIYFKAAWKQPFEEENTQTRDFHINENEHIEMEMMSKSVTLKYRVLSDLNAKFLEIPYAGDEVSMYIILPNEINGLAAIEENLSGKSFNSLFKKMGPVKVNLRLPKFEMTQELNLGKILQTMGVVDVFDPVACDLTALASDSSGLVLSELIHKAFIQVNEEGTEAAGSTAGIITLTSLPRTEDFFVDRPFIFFIREKATGNILFMGRMNQSPVETPVIGSFGLTMSDNNSNGASSVNTVSLLIVSILSLCNVIFMS